MDANRGSMLTGPVLKKDRQTHQPSQSAVLYGLLGVVCFSLTLPATRIAATEIDSNLVGFGRGVGAALPAALLLLITRQRPPRGREFLSLAIVAIGGIVLFPVFSAWAMFRVPASHGAVVLALLPICTAVVARVRTRERPNRLFWISTFVACATVALYATRLGIGSIQTADLYLFGAVLSGAISYAEGGHLGRQLGGWQVICWALVLSFPFLMVIVWELAPRHVHATERAWIALAYLCLVSQLLGFCLWYKGLSLGGIARVSQLQFMQPFLTIGFSALILKESVSLPTIVTALFVVLCVACGVTSTDRAIPKTPPRVVAQTCPESTSSENTNAANVRGT